MKKIKSGKNSIAHGIKLFYKLLIHTKNHGLFATFKKTVVYFKNKKLPIITNNSFENAQINYSNWINDHEDFSFEKKQKMRSEVDTWEKHPLISVIMPTYNPDVTWLIEAIDSVRNQIYPYWELCIADDASTDIQAKETLIRYSESDQRIKVIFRNSNGHISEASNTALENASGDWIAFLDQDDLVSPDALFHIAKNINNHIDALIIYSDEDKIDLKGQRTLPFFKPDWSPHLACQQAYLGHLVCINKTKTKNKICFDPTKNGAQDYDLWLQASLSEGKIIHIPHILYHWRMHQESTALNADSKPYADTAGLLAVTNYIKNKYPKADVTVSNGKHLFTYKLDFPVQEKLISVIIPTKDKIELLKPCINSIFEKSINNKYEIIIIDNNSFEEETFEYFSELKSQHSNVKIVTAPIAFNWSILNNIGRNNAVGDYLVFLNNDTEVITDDWLDRLTGYCALPDVAITGAVLKYPDGTIQHNGVVVGMGGWADHIYKSSAHMHCGAGPFISPALTRNTSAVTGACMAISTEKFDEIGGFDENFIICGSDVEICLRAMKNGYFNLVCSEVELYHYESKTRDTFIPEIDFEQSALKYEPYRTQLCDPFFNINLDKNSPNPKLK